MLFRSMAPAVAGVRPRGAPKAQVRKVHPNDPQFRTALDTCHALAMAYVEALPAQGESGAIGTVRALVNRHRVIPDSGAVRLMEALVNAAPRALQVSGGPQSAAARFPEFRAWHAILAAVFGVAVPDWTVKPSGHVEGLLDALDEQEEEDEEDTEGEEE